LKKKKRKKLRIEPLMINGSTCWRNDIGRTSEFLDPHGGERPQKTVSPLNSANKKISAECSIETQEARSANAYQQKRWLRAGGTIVGEKTPGLAEKFRCSRAVGRGEKATDSQKASSREEGNCRNHLWGTSRTPEVFRAFYNSEVFPETIFP